MSPKNENSGELYAELAATAAASGAHHLAADMYLIAIQSTLGGLERKREYLARANEERAKAYGASVPA